MPWGLKLREHNKSAIVVTKIFDVLKARENTFRKRLWRVEEKSALKIVD